MKVKIAFCVLVTGVACLALMQSISGGRQDQQEQAGRGTAQSQTGATAIAREGAAAEGGEEIPMPLFVAENPLTASGVTFPTSTHRVATFQMW